MKSLGPREARILGTWMRMKKQFEVFCVPIGQKIKDRVVRQGKGLLFIEQVEKKLHSVCFQIQSHTSYGPIE